MFDITEFLGLDKFEKVLSRFENLPMNIVPERCCGRRTHVSCCSECERVCPTGAIDLTSGVEVDFAKCVGCGLCATLCPTGVFKLKPPDMRVLAEAKAILDSQQSTGKYVCFGCIDAGDSPYGIHVNCLGRLNEALMLGTVFFGAEHVLLLREDCDACEIECGGVVIASVVESSQKLLQAYGSSAKIMFVDEVPDEVVLSRPKQLDHVDRRDFLTYAKKNVMAAGSEFFADKLSAFSQQVEEVGFKYDLPEKRELLLTILRKMGRPVSEEPIELSGTPFTQVKISEDCFLCKQCELFCPTGALSTTETDKGASVNVSLANCTKCNLCQAICPVEAVSYGDKVVLSKALTDEREPLIDLEMRECKECHQQFGSTGQLETCGYCLKRQEKTGDDSWR